MSRRKRLPPLPTEIATPLGPLPIKVAEAKTLPSGKGSGGCYDSRGFCIYIAADLAPHVQWQVLWHERIHAICDLYGVQLSEKQEEAVCSAIATAMVADMLR